MTCSYLGRDGQFYASIVRYVEGYGKGKVVVLARKAATLELAVTQLAENFVGLVGAKDDLRRHLRGER